MELSCSVACGIFSEQGSNPCPLHWQAGSQPLHHQGSPSFCFNLSSLLLVPGKYYSPPITWLLHILFPVFKGSSELPAIYLVISIQTSNISWKITSLRKIPRKIPRPHEAPIICFPNIVQVTFHSIYPNSNEIKCSQFYIFHSLRTGMISISSPYPLH